MAVIENGKALFAGRVLADRERNFYDDSDFYVVVFDEGQLKSYEYGSTRFPGGGYAEVDATPEVVEQAEEWLEKWAFEQFATVAVENARKPEKGKQVRVVRGRKVPHGTEGVLFWLGEKTYGFRNKVTTAGIRLEDGSVVFTNITNLVVVDPENYLESLVEIQERAKKFARKRNWHIPFVRAGMIAL